MSDTVVDPGTVPVLDLGVDVEINIGPQHAQFFLDGDIPRLANAPSAAPPPSARSEFRPLAGLPDSDSIVDLPPPPPSPVLPLISPVLTSSAGHANAPAASAGAGSTDHQGESTPAPPPRHPMAHLMPDKVVPSESSIRAAQTRAARKAKAKRTKLIVAACMLVFTAVVGPPFWKWLTNALNEAGSTKPAAEQPAD
jgi:hypothetical protein